jgi:hypothetical protein
VLFGLAFRVPYGDWALWISEGYRHEDELLHPGGFRGIDQIAIAFPVYRLDRILSTTLSSARRCNNGLYSFTKSIERAALFEIAQHNLRSRVCQKLVVGLRAGKDANGLALRQEHPGNCATKIASGSSNENHSLFPFSLFVFHSFAGLMF